MENIIIIGAVVLIVGGFLFDKFLIHKAAIVAPKAPAPVTAPVPAPVAVVPSVVAAPAPVVTVAAAPVA